MSDNTFAVFESYKIRRVYNAQVEMWFFSIVDIIQALTGSPNPTDYLKKMRRRDPELGQYLGTNCPQEEMLSATGKRRRVLAGTVEHLLRIIQAIPSAKAEPIKVWLAKVGYERLQEIVDPEQSLKRARENWSKAGHSEKWIQQRMLGQETRSKLTDYWSTHGVAPGKDFGVLTNVIHEEWSDLSVRKHKDIKGLKNQNLRDHMTEAELLFTALAELSTRQIAESMSAQGMQQNIIASKKGGRVAKNARVELEENIGRPVISSDNFLKLPRDSKKLKG